MTEYSLNGCHVLEFLLECNWKSLLRRNHVIKLTFILALIIKLYCVNIFYTLLQHNKITALVLKCASYTAKQ